MWSYWQTRRAVGTAEQDNAGTSLLRSWVFVLLGPRFIARNHGNHLAGYRFNEVWCHSFCCHLCGLVLAWIRGSTQFELRLLCSCDHWHHLCLISVHSYSCAPFVKLFALRGYLQWPIIVDTPNTAETEHHLATLVDNERIRSSRRSRLITADLLLCLVVRNRISKKIEIFLN